jgi:DNA-binding CsgD family transcriptional regulator
MHDRSVSKHAAKFILNSIYSKVGISNQVALISLLREAPLGWNGQGGVE